MQHSTTNTTEAEIVTNWWGNLGSIKANVLRAKYFPDYMIIDLEQQTEIYKAEHPQVEAKKDDVWEVFIQPNATGTERTINAGSKRIATLCEMPTIEESEANARLIASAPRLARENEQLVKLVNDNVAERNRLREVVKELQSSNRELVKALIPLAEMDLEGVNTSMDGNVVYQRNKTYINVGDVYNAKKAIDNNTKL